MCVFSWIHLDGGQGCLFGAIANDSNYSAVPLSSGFWLSQSLSVSHLTISLHHGCTYSRQGLDSEPACFHLPASQDLCRLQMVFVLIGAQLPCLARFLWENKPQILTGDSSGGRIISSHPPGVEQY